MKQMLPGAHNGNIGSEGENILEWVSIFNQFRDKKKHHPSKSAKEEKQHEKQ